MQREDKIEFFKLRNFSDKFSVAIEFLQQNFKAFFKISLLIMGPIAILEAILIYEFQQNIFQNSSNISVSGTPFTNFFAVLMQSGFTWFFLVFYAIAIFVTITFLNFMKIYKDKYPEDFTAKDVLLLNIRVFFKVVIYNILVSFVVMVGFIFFFIPGIYLMVVLSLGTPVIVFEGKGVFEAFDRSFKLINGKWWSTFGVLVIGTILSFFISLLFQLPQEIFNFLWEALTAETVNNEIFTGGYSTLSILHLIFSCITYLGALLSYSITQFALGFQYTNLVERLESVGLMNEIDKIDVDN